MSDMIARAEIEARIAALREQQHQLELQTYAVKGAIEAYIDLLARPTALSEQQKAPPITRNVKRNRQGNKS